MKSAAFFWLVLLVVFLIAEAACPIHLVSIWFALGALVALLCAALSAPVWLQITLFVVVSGVLLALLWPLAKKFLNPRSRPPMWTPSSAPSAASRRILTMWRHGVR